MAFRLGRRVLTSKEYESYSICKLHAVITLTSWSKIPVACEHSTITR